MIDLEALRWNFHQAKKKVGPRVKILSVVKANAYGHGDREVAKTLQDEGSAGFGVATLEEGIGLRKGGVQCPIVVLGGVFPEQLDDILEHQLTPVVFEKEPLRQLEAMVQRREISLGIHLKVDTGMGRIGLLSSETASWLPELARLRALKIEGVLSHFSQAERVEGEHTRGQLESFRSVLRQLHSKGIRPPLIHLANSAAVITFPQAHFTMVRPGLMLYGLYPSQEMTRQVTLKPALSWKTQIIQLKRVAKGFGVSYGRTFVTHRESVIAVLPVGYADGYSRLLSNRGSVLIRGQRAPVVGTVCMDLTMVDVTDIRGVRQGDEVVLLGKQGGETISADEMARWADTISYEILTSISARVPRIHVGQKGA